MPLSPPMRISPAGLSFIKSFESFVPYLYDDLIPPHKGSYAEWNGAPVRGTLTIGYGHTASAKAQIHMGRGARVTEAEACAILDIDLDECELAVNASVHRPLTQGQFDALVSFAFNCGMGNARNIIARINRGDMASARAAFDLYVTAKDRSGKRQFMRGLQRRRDGEQELWDISDAFELHAPIQRLMPAEPVHHTAAVDAPQRRKTMLESKEGWTASIGGAAALVPVVKAGADLAQDATDTARQVAGLLADPWVLGACAAVTVAALAYLLFKRWQRSHEELVA